MEPTFFQKGICLSPQKNFSAFYMINKSGKHPIPTETVVLGILVKPVDS
ncbi:MAG TPA: hypothetical protein VKA98_00475 [Nitrososphaeraceae archaeon]|nr:hypothetical protein [Nitrososphaeraceae archaeon]